MKRKLKVQISEREETKLFLFTDDIITYAENSKELTKKLLELISNYSKVGRYKVNIQKSITFLYTSNEKSGNKNYIEKIVVFTITSKKNKMFRNTFKQ